ncbi:MAG: B12-binding domain-containing radical SAM protein [Candidatus Helarchaeota archaeon]
MNTLYSGPFTRILLVKPRGPSGLAFALNPIPLGLESIAGNIREDVESILIYDQFMDKEPFHKVLASFKPDFVGFSLSATEHNSGGELMNVIKKFDKKIPIVAGGYHPSGAPEIVLKDLKCDAACRGEGEGIMKDLVKGMDWKDIKGLSFKDPKNNGKIIHNEERELISDLDTLPFPARDLRKKRGYKYNNILVLNRDYDLMEFGRGCFGKCTFCCEPYYSRSRQRYRSPERTLKEIKLIYKQHKYKPLRILIADPNILGNPRKVSQLADLLLEANLDVSFQVMSRTELIVRHKPIIEKMVRAGMISWELGIESPTQEDLDSTKKNIPLEVQKESIKILRDLGAETLGTFVIGLTNHSSKFIKTFPTFARNIGLSAAAFGIATPFPGTEYWNELASKNLIFEKDWTKFDENHCVINHPTLSPREIEKLRNWCTAKFWNIDTVVEQIRLDGIRVGKFRSKHKATIRDLIMMVGKKLLFAADAGSELAGKEEGDHESNYAEHAKFMFDAWADPKLEEYFKKYPLYEIIDMRQFGKLFSKKRIQAVIEDGNKKCVFAMLIKVGDKGIETIKTSKKPSLKYDFLIRSDLNSLFMDPNLSQMSQLKQLLKRFSSGRVRIKGYPLLFKLALYGIKEALSIRLTNGKI